MAEETRPIIISNTKPITNNKIKFTQVPDDTGLDLSTIPDQDNPRENKVEDIGYKSLNVLLSQVIKKDRDKNQRLDLLFLK